MERGSLEIAGRPYFNFVPNSFGPFDRDVYDVLENLAPDKLVEIRKMGGFRRLAPTPAGFKVGAANIERMAPNTSFHLKEVADWVRSMDFRQLVASIYNQYPDMGVNSVFRE